MVRPDFRNFQMNPYYLSHGGPGSGRYPLGSGERPYQRRQNKGVRMKNRLRKRFDKSDEKSSKLKDKADKEFSKASRQRNSVFKSQRNKAERTIIEGYKLEEKRQRLEYRTSKYYEKYANKFVKMDVKMDKDLRKKGKEYYDRVLENTNNQYKAVLLRKVVYNR